MNQILEQYSKIEVTSIKEFQKQNLKDGTMNSTSTMPNKFYWIRKKVKYFGTYFSSFSNLMSGNISFNVRDGGNPRVLE